MLSKKGLTTKMEPRKYYQTHRKVKKQICKQGYSQQRKCLDPEVFRHMNQEYPREFYGSAEPKEWKGNLILAIDGSKAEVLNSEESHKGFSQRNNQHADDGQVRALVRGIYDALNEFSVVLLFHRGYASIEFMNHLEKNGHSYLFRLSSNDYKRERQGMADQDEAAELFHSGRRLQKVKKRHSECLEKLKWVGKTGARLLNYQLPSGTALTLMTNLPQERYA